MADPAVSIVIPLWNGAAFIPTCLEALSVALAQIPDEAEIVVVDNGSTDGGADWVAAHYRPPGVTLIRNGRNLGFAGACNAGLRAARGERLVLLNQDTQVEPSWLAQLTAGLDQAPAIAGSLALLEDGETIQHAGGIIDWPLGLARHQGYGERQGQPAPADPDFVTAAAMAFPRRLLADIGFFDEQFWPGYYEDVDLCYRARAAGYTIRTIPEAQLIHKEHSSFGDQRLAGWARLRGRLRFCLKHVSPAFFLQEFLPAEEIYRASVLSGDAGGEIARAYLEAIPMLVDLWQNVATPQQIQEGSARLRALYAPPPFFVSVDKSVEKSFAGGDKYPAPAAVKPVLTPSAFEELPLLGPVWRGIRHRLHSLVIFYVEMQNRRYHALIRRQAAEIQRLEALLAQSAGHKGADGE